MPAAFSAPDGVLFVDSPLRPPDAYDELLELLQRRPEWHQRAACKELPKEAFFVDQRKGVNPADEVAKARAVCSGCPVCADCFEAGGRERYGMWAGLTVVERRDARRSKRTAA